LAAQWQRRKAKWLRERGIDPNSADWKIALADLASQAQYEFHRTFTAEFDGYLVRGLGACALRPPAPAAIVANSLHGFNDVRYLLGDYVVMPNHVHLLCCLLGETDIEAQCKSWKRFTAREINARLGTAGRFWQEESFDHLVRSPEQFDHLRAYIADNPMRANLNGGEFLHYGCPMGA
jgi:type I restriction enzyme R subunit